MKSWGIPCGLNPWSGTEDLRRGDFDIWADIPAGQILLELKDDFKSATTPNFAIELKAFDHSKAPLFIYRIRNPDLIIALHRSEIEELLRQTKLTPQGRFLRYNRIQMGDQPDNLGILIPKEISKTVGRPFETAIRQLTKQAA